MANRRCLESLTRYFRTLTPVSQTLAAASAHTRHRSLNRNISGERFTAHLNSAVFARNFCSRYTDDDDDSEEEEDFSEGEEESGNANRSPVLSAEEKEHEASEIGYTVVGQLEKSDRVFKPYEPVFAVVQIGSHQFKVSNRDTVYVERLKHCDVNDKLVLNKVLMLGSQTQTIIGRPILPDAAVHAVVEEHALDAKVIIFKKKRRKNYRRTKGHRQELTKLRITDIQGIEKPEIVTPPKKEKKEKVAVEA